MTLSEPRIVTRAPQAFAAIVLELAQNEIPSKAPPLIADVIAWMQAHGIATAGAPFFNYTHFRPGGRMVMQVGMPAASPVTGDAAVIGGVLPGGRYASVTHTGPYHELREANMALMDWARREGLELNGDEREGEFADATRLELYHEPGTGPGEMPVTEVAFRLKE
jgi:effector-binding domain-containing protein